MKELTIRIAREEDIESMAQLDKICFSAPWSKESFESEIVENARALYIVAIVDNELVGYAGMWGILDEGHITNIAVHPDHRRKHIGEALVSILAKTAEESGIDKLTLEVRKSNEPAKALYKKLGFEAKGLRKGYYEDNNEDAIIMWRGEYQGI